MSIFSLTPIRYTNSFRAKAILRAIELKNTAEAAEELGITVPVLGKWTRLYGHVPREELIAVAEGLYDSPQSFLRTLEANAPYNNALYHAAQCRKIGLSPELYCEEFAGVEVGELTSMYKRIHRIPLDQLDELLNPTYLVTPINFPNLIKNLTLTVNALFKGSQVAHPSPITAEELQRMKSLSSDLTWAIGRYETCLLESTPIEKSSK